MKKSYLLLLLAAQCGLAFSALGQSAFYVRAGANGNGSDWNNAFGDLPSNLTRGATYYVADGTYGGHTFNTAASGTTRITIRKATESEHGTNTGWSSSYGDGQATFTGMIGFNTGYWTFDGGRRNENDWSAESDYGFYVTATSGKMLRFDAGSSSGNIVVKHVAFHHAGGLGAGQSDGRDIVYSLGGVNNTMTRCKFYNAGRTHFLFRGCTAYTVEYSWIDRNESNSSEHAESASALNSPNCVFRFNVFRNIQGTGVLVFGQGSDGWKIYGNTVFNWDTQANGIFCGWTAEYATNAEIYNNTIVSCANGRIGFTNDTGFKTYNNIFIDTPNVSFLGKSHSHDYNAADVDLGEAHSQRVNSSILRSSSSGDFRLTQPTAAGMTLASTFSADMNDAARGSDGSWDRGAYEFGASTAGTAPAAPSGLSANP